MCQPARLGDATSALARRCWCVGPGAGGAGALAGCGGEPSFTAEEFVDGVNAEGVELRLGEPLVTDEESKELYAVELEPVGAPPADSEGEPGHIGGSLSVYDENGGGADDEIATCENAADLLCFRAANVVVVLEGGGIEAQQFAVAMQRLSED